MTPVASPDQQILQQQDTTNAIAPPVQEPDPNEIAKQEAAKAERQDKIESAVKELMKLAEKEDEDLRWPMLRRAKRNEYYFNNIQKIYFDEVARDYRTIDSIVDELANFAPVDNIKTINVYRAYAESLIAALSVSEPSVEFSPDDADNPDDIQTAQAYSKIAELVRKHNFSSLMHIKALTIQFNQGLVAGFNFYKTDPAYGVYSSPKRTETKSTKTFDILCPQCHEVIDTQVPEAALPQQSQIICPECNFNGPPVISAKLENTDEVVEWEDTPKGRALFDIFGMTNVKVPLYARRQTDCGYVILRLEDHIAKWKAAYEDYADEITTGGGDTYTYERWSRIPPEYYGTIPKNIATGRFGFFRPWYFNVLGAEEAALLKEEYPNGLFATCVNDLLVEIINEKLDDRWTLSFDPRSQFIHAEPPGNALVPLQDCENDLFNLGEQTIEYGIPETFAHPKTLNLEHYSKSGAAPGMISPALPPGPDKSLSDGFFTVKAGTLTGEYTSFYQGLRTTQQFVTGAFPSLFGGDMNNGSETATEYTESKSRAQQRLYLTNQIVTAFWSGLIYKCCRDYAKNLREDESFSKKNGGTYINVWIRKSELAGKVGEMSPELNGQLPQSWGQKKDFVMSLVKLQDPIISQILLHPNNSELIKEVVGIPEFYLPGEHDRNKQLQEYYALSAGTQIPIDVVVDDHAVHMQVLKNILVSSQGIYLYQTNPDFYQLCIDHYRQHEMAQQAKTIAASGNTTEQQPAESATQSTQG
jgi:hypothetical protein